MYDPYSIRAKYARQTGIVELFPQGIELIWRIKLTDIIKEITKAVNKVYEELQQKEMRKKERAALDKASIILKETLIKAEMLN